MSLRWEGITASTYCVPAIEQCLWLLVELTGCLGKWSKQTTDQENDLSEAYNRGKGRAETETWEGAQGRLLKQGDTEADRKDRKSARPTREGHVQRSASWEELGLFEELKEGW